MIYVHRILKKHPNLSPEGFCVLSAIAERILGSRQNQTIYPTTELSWLIGISKRQVQRCIGELKTEKLVFVIGKTKKNQNIYSLPADIYFDITHKPSRRKARAPD